MYCFWSAFAGRDGWGAGPFDGDTFEKGTAGLGMFMRCMTIRCMTVQQPNEGAGVVGRRAEGGAWIPAHLKALRRRGARRAKAPKAPVSRVWTLSDGSEKQNDPGSEYDRRRTLL